MPSRCLKEVAEGDRIAALEGLMSAPRYHKNIDQSKTAGPVLIRHRKIAPSRQIPRSKNPRTIQAFQGPPLTVAVEPNRIAR